MAIHLFTLFAFVVCRPIFTLLADHPVYFVANNMHAADIYLAVATLSIVIPLLLTSLVAVAGLLRGKIQLLVQSLFCAGFLSIFILHLTNDLSFVPIRGKLILCVFAFGVFSLLYYKKRSFSLIITFLSPVIVLFPLLFLFDQNVGRVTQADNELNAPNMQSGALSLEQNPPIVMIVFDELPLVDLLDFKGQIDASRFPNFARLASQATWYKNATTVDYRTQVAVPAILSGERPKPGRLPVFSEYPHNLFALLEGHYSFHVIEPITRLFQSAQNKESPETAKLPGVETIGSFFADMSVVYLHIVLPKELSAFVPAINDQWGGFLPPSILKDIQKNRVKKYRSSDRAESLLSFISNLGSYPAATLHFIHTMLPHRPSRYLPSGRIYTYQKFVKGLSLVRDSGSNSWQGQQMLADRMHQRLLLQIGYVDGLLGQLLDAMKSAAIFEDSMLIVVADHGANYQQNLPVRYPTAENFGEVAFVPLFIKYPAQKHAIQEEFNAETIDILPTIIDVLGAKTSWDLDGQSLADRDSPKRPNKLVQIKSDGLLTYSESEYLAARENAHAKNIANFSLADPRSDLFHFEPGLDLIGTEVAALVNERAPCSVQSEMIEELREVDLSEKFLPTGIDGEISCTSKNFNQMLLVVSVNGVIHGITNPYMYNNEILFSVIISDEVFQNGSNDIELFTVWKKGAKNRTESSLK